MKKFIRDMKQILPAAAGRLDLIARAMEVRSASIEWLLGGGVCGF